MESLGKGMLHLSMDVLTLVCPVYNEAENMPRLLDRLEAEVRTPFKLFVVYDRDDDTTLPVLYAQAGRFHFPICLIKNRYGRGVLNAVKTGLEAADGVAIAVIMADLSDDLSTID